MQYFKLVSFLIISVFLVSCGEEEHNDEYKEFKTEPKYITHPNTAQITYFEAYDKVLQKWDVDYEELYITTSKGIAHVISSGPKNGVPVVLFHGMTATSTMWYPNAKALSSEYRLFAIDLIIEPGKSYKTADVGNIQEITEWYQEIFWALKLDSFHLVGASRGGWSAVDLALKSKRDIRSMILLSPAQTIVWIPPSAGLAKNLINMFSSKEKQVEGTLNTMSVNSDKMDASYKAQYHLSQKVDSLGSMAMQMTPFSNSALSTLKMPVLVLIGDEDIINSKRAVKLTKKHIPKGQGEVISNAGHFLSVDQAEEVNQKMLNFLRNVDEGRRKS